VGEAYDWGSKTEDINQRTLGSSAWILVKWKTYWKPLELIRK
jgi:hypothetical protein